MPKLPPGVERMRISEQRKSYATPVEDGEDEGALFATSEEDIHRESNQVGLGIAPRHQQQRQMKFISPGEDSSKMSKHWM